MKPLILIIISSALIASTPIIGKLGTQLLNPALFAFYNMSFASIGMSIIYLIKRPKFKKKAGKPLIITGLIFGVGVLLYFTSLSMTSPVNIAFLGQFQLVFVMLISFFLLKERINSKKLFGAMIVLIGGLFIIYEESINVNWGWILALITFLIYAFVNYYRKVMRDLRVDTVTILFLNVLIPVFMLLPYLLAMNIPFIVNDGIIYALINALIVDIAGAYLFIQALKRIELSKAFIAFVTMPLFTIIYSLIIFGVDITILQVIGGALLIGGNVIANKSEVSA